LETLCKDLKFTIFINR